MENKNFEIQNNVKFIPLATLKTNTGQIEGVMNEGFFTGSMATGLVLNQTPSGTHIQRTHHLPTNRETETGKKATKRQKIGKYTRGDKRAEKSAFCGENK